MLATVLAACGTAISYAVAWLDHFYSKVPGASTLVLVGFFIWTATRLLLRPIIGSAASGEGLVNVYRGTGRVLMMPVAAGSAFCGTGAHQIAIGD